MEDAHESCDIITEEEYFDALIGWFQSGDPSFIESISGKVCIMNDNEYVVCRGVNNRDGTLNIDRYNVCNEPMYDMGAAVDE